MIAISFNPYDNFCEVVCYLGYVKCCAKHPKILVTTKSGLFLAHFTTPFPQALFLNLAILGPLANIPARHTLSLHCIVCTQLDNQ